MSGSTESSTVSYHVVASRPVHMSVVVKGVSREAVQRFVQTGIKPDEGEIVFYEETGDPEAQLQHVRAYESVSAEEFIARGRDMSLMTCINGKLVFGDVRRVAV